MVAYATDYGPYGSSAKGLRYNLATDLAAAMRNGGQVAPILKLLAKTETKVAINEQKKGGPQSITDMETNGAHGGKPMLMFRDTIPQFNSNNVKNYRLEWDDFIKRDDETTSTATLATTATTLTVANAANLALQPSSGARKSYVQLNGGEIVEVTAIAGNDLTIVRGQLGTADPGTTYAIGTRVVVHILFQEGSDFIGGIEAGSTREFNWTQIWRREYSLSGTAMALETTGGVSQLKFQRKIKAHEIMNQMAHNAIYGVRNESGSGATRIATMAGVIRYGTTVNGLTFNKANLRTQLDTYAVQGGNLDEAIVLCGTNVWGKLCDLKDLYTVNGGQDMDREEINFDVKALKFWDFRIPFAPDNTLNADDMLILNPKHADLVMMQGRELEAKPMGLSGDNKKEMLLAEGSLKVRLGSRNIRYYSNVG